MTNNILTITLAFLFSHFARLVHAQSERTVVDLSNNTWKLWLDTSAKWVNDTLYAPKKPDGTDFTAQEFVLEMRNNMSQFISTLHLGQNPFAPSILVDRFGPMVFNLPTMVNFFANTTFKANNAGIDDAKFKSVNPFGAIMQFDSIHDDMGVVVSKNDNTKFRLYGCKSLDFPNN